MNAKERHKDEGRFQQLPAGTRKEKTQKKSVDGVKLPARLVHLIPWVSIMHNFIMAQHAPFTSPEELTFTQALCPPTVSSHLFSYGMRHNPIHPQHVVIC